MAEVIDFAAAREEREPHMQGLARCAGCRHEWQAVSPVGVVEALECPKCSAMKGFLVHTVMRGEQFFECNCGCDVFRISPVHGPYCLNCAVPATGWF